MSFCRGICERRSERVLRMVREAMANDNHGAFLCILSRHRSIVTQHIPEILQTVVRNKQKKFLETLDELLYLPYDPQGSIKYSEICWFPLHDAIRTDNIEWVSILCEHKVFGNKSKIPPIFCALEWGKRKGCLNIDTDLQILEILIKSGENINSFYEHETPIFFAAKLGMWHCVQLLLKYNANIDSFCGNYLTARQLISECQPYLLVPVKHPDTKFHLIQALKLKKEEVFLKLIEKHQDLVNNEDDQGFTLLQRAIQNNMQKSAKKLITLGADPNKANLDADYNKEDKFNRSSPPLIMTIIRGQKSLFKLLMNNKNINISKIYTGNNTIYHLLARDWKQMRIENIEIVDCVDKLFIEAFSRGVNILQKNDKGIVAVSKACKTRDKILLEMFFKFGAFSSLTQFDLLKIDPEDLNSFFDHTITSNLNQDKGRSHIEISYSFIDAPVMCKTRKERVEKFNSRLDSFDNLGTTSCITFTKTKDTTLVNSNYREMNVFYQISKSHIHQHILKHPVIKLFLYLKWKKICRFYFLNFIFYTLFTTFLSFYIYNMEQNIKSKTLNSFELYSTTWFVTLILWIIFIFRESSQFYLSYKHYFLSIENLLEVTLIVTVGYLLFLGPHREIASIAVILTFIELTLLLDRYPYVSLYITIFVQVSRKTLGLLIMFSPVIFSFAYGFFIIFLSSSNKEFEKVGFSFIKSLTMLAGELQIEDKYFEESPLISRGIFVLFVIFLVIVFSNVLSALAISDTQLIIDKAELISCIEEISLYYKLEKLWLDYFIKLKFSNIYIFKIIYQFFDYFHFKLDVWFNMKVCPMFYCYSNGSYYRLYPNTPTSVSNIMRLLYKYVFGMDHIKLSKKIIEILQKSNKNTISLFQREYEGNRDKKDTPCMKPFTSGFKHNVFQCDIKNMDCVDASNVMLEKSFKPVMNIDDNYVEDKLNDIDVKLNNIMKELNEIKLCLSNKN